MSCEIIYRGENPASVEGVNREVFNQIMSNPHVEGFDKALDIYLNVEDKNISDKQLKYEANGNTYNSLKEVLKNTNNKDKITVSVEGVKLFEVPNDDSLNTFGSAVNSLIKADLLKEATVINERGERIYQPEGFSEERVAINATYIEEDFTKVLGINGFKKHKDGSFKVTDKKELKKSKFDTIVEDSMKEFSRAFSETPITTEEVPTENQLQRKLLNLLSSMGISVMSITDYVEKFAIKNKSTIKAQALADMANRIVAFAEGQLTLENLTEEAAHFIVEGTPKQELQLLLDNVHKLSEWAEFENYYRNLYSENYKGEELEEAVRKEILGKYLARTLSEKFNEENKTATELGFLERLKQIVLNFFSTVQSYFNDNYKKALDEYTDFVYVNLMNDSLSNNLSEESLNQSKFTLFSSSATPNANLAKVQLNVEKSITLLTSQELKLFKGRGSRRSQDTLQELRELDVLKGEEEKKLAIAKITSLVASQVGYLRQSVENNKANAYPLAQEEEAVYTNISNHMLPYLNELAQMLDKTDSEESQIKDEIDKVILAINELEGVVGKYKVDIIEKYVDKLAEKHSMTQSQRNDLLAIYRAQQKDTTWFHANIGTLMHSQNAFLNIAGDIIAEMTTKANINYLGDIKPFLKKLEDLGFDPSMLKKLAKNGYLINDINFDVVEAEELKVSTDLYNSIKNTALTTEEYKKQKTENKLDLTAAEQKKFNAEYREITKGWYESYFTEAYLKKREEMYDKVGTESFFRDFVKAQSADIARIHTRATDSKGKINLTAYDKEEIQQIKKEKAIAKNPFDSDGKFKKGLSMDKDGKLQLDPTSTDVSAILAYRLTKLDEALLEEIKNDPSRANKSAISKDFKDKLESLSDEEAIEFLFLNSYISFSNETWDSLSGNVKFLDKVKDAITEDNKDEIEEVIERINLLQLRKTNILKANRVLGSPSETNYAGMSKAEKDSIKDIMTELQSLFREANSFLEDKEKENVDSLFETTPNEAYNKLILDSAETEFDGRIKLIRDHVTPSDRERLDQLVIFANKFIKGDISTIPKRYAAIFSGSTNKDTVEMEVLKYGEYRLLPYFQRFEPKEYTEVLAQMRNGVISTTQFLDNYEAGLYPSIEFTPNYSYLETQNNVNINPKFKQNVEEGKSQLKINQENRSRGFLNEGWQNELTQKELEAREILLQLQDSTLEAYGQSGRHNRYLLPQQGRRGFRQVEAFMKESKGKNFKEIVLDLVNYREDESQFGQNQQGSALQSGKRVLPSQYISSNTVPMYGLRKLENQSDVTDELVASYAWMNQQAHLYRARVESIGDMFAVKDAVLNSDWAGKSAEATRAYNMFKSFMDYNYYGVKESFSYEVDLFGIKVDMSRVAQLLKTFIRTVNLGYSVTVPFTSLLTGGVQEQIEKFVGERINPMAYKLANREFTKLAGEATGETLEFNSKAKLNILGEYFQIFDLDNRFKNSNYNKLFRAMPKIGMALHSAANFPIIPRVMLSQLYNFRVVGGTEGIVNYNQFKNARVGLDVKEIEQEWKKYEDQAIYNFLEIEEGTVKYNKAKLETLLGKSGEELDKYIDLKNLAITNAIQASSMDIDANIPESMKSDAARHGLLSFFLIHRSFLTLALQRRFKDRHFNTLTGEYEEGVYMNGARFLKMLVSNYKLDKQKGFVNTVKDSWVGADETTKRNMKRMLIEFGVLNTLAAAAFLLANYADDDENKDLWALQYANYLLYRTSVESTSNAFGVGESLYEALESPIIGMDKLKQVANAGDLFSSAEVENGKYRGYTERERWLYKTAPVAKEYFNLSNLDKTSQTYEFYNKDNYNFFIIPHVAGLRETKEDNK